LVERENLARFKLCGGLENSVAMQEGCSRESGLGVLFMQHTRRAGLKEVVGSYGSDEGRRDRVKKGNS
jgi:hypothetical protein